MSLDIRGLLRELNGTISGLTQSYRNDMTKTRLSSKGQVILPKSVRDAHRWPVGMEFNVEDTADGVLLRPAKPFGIARLEDLAGCLRVEGAPKTIDEMNDAIDQEIRQRHDRGRY
jgi:AbrB family looped-hinge helix DNA binding protein